MFEWNFKPRSSGPAEWAVLLWAFVILLVLAGVVALVISVTAASENPEVAAALVRYGIRALLTGVVIGTATWVARRLID